MYTLLTLAALGSTFAPLVAWARRDRFAGSPLASPGRPRTTTAVGRVRHAVRHAVHDAVHHAGRHAPRLSERDLHEAADRCTC